MPKPPPTSERSDDEVRRPTIHHAEVVIPCPQLDPTLRFFVERLGFSVERIFPADAPRMAVVSGHGLRLRLDPETTAPPGALCVYCEDPMTLEGETTLVAPNGTRVTMVPATRPLVLPPLAPSLTACRISDAHAWVTGRAGMQYRDLIPDRQGGRFIASHIRIPNGGPVPDYVHHHQIRLQMIYCHRGWVKVVYEDQGPPFVLEPGDAVLQPPHIRHQVLESSDGLEVIELSSPAEHETLGDLEMTLPTTARRPDREFGGQRFVRHRAAEAQWSGWRLRGWSACAMGIGAATRGLASAHIARPLDGGDLDTTTHEHDQELRWIYVLAGSVTLIVTGRPNLVLGTDDCVVVPAGLPHALDQPSSECRLLEIALPATR